MKLAGAGIGVFATGEDLQEGGLASAVGTGQPNPLARTDLERDPVQDRLGAKVLLYTLNINDNHPTSVVASKRRIITPW
jgi:hypothetical protein